jgi:hypothetical protein
MAAKQEEGSKQEPESRLLPLYCQRRFHTAGEKPLKLQ